MKLALTIFSLYITTLSIAQSYVTQARPADTKEWGYINEKGDWIIKPQYRKCGKFSEGYAPIYEGKKFFFINIKGEKLKTEINNYKLKNVFGIGMQGFTDGMAPVVVKKKHGYLSTDGKLAIDLKYDKALTFNNGFGVVAKGGNFFVINKKGEEFPVKNALDVKVFSEGLAPFKSTNKLLGFISTDGSVVIKPQFSSVGYFTDGLAWAKTTDKKVGFINKKGEWVIEPTYLVAKDFDKESGIARVKEDITWIYINKKGEKVSFGVSERTKPFKNGLALGKKGEQWGAYNNEGKWIIEAKFDGLRTINNGYLAAKKGDKWGFINAKGEWVIEPTLDAVKDMELVN